MGISIFIFVRLKVIIHIVFFKTCHLRPNIIKNENNQNVFQIIVKLPVGGLISVDIFDFNTNCIISWSFGNVQFMCPTEFLTKSTGLLIEGPNHQ